MSRRRGDGRSVGLLLVEPDRDDARRLAAAFDDVSRETEVHVVETGEEALDFVRQPGGDAPGVDVVLLDLEHPDAGGADVLREIKGSPASRHLPVVVLGSADAEDDVVRSYELHANAYVAKPDDEEAFADFAAAFAAFWFSIVKLPTER